MGVGATPGDVATMVSNAPDQCAFACHDLNNPNNYYNLAKKLNVTTRIDVVRSAPQKLMDTATATANLPNRYRAAIYTFGTTSAIDPNLCTSMENRGVKIVILYTTFCRSRPMPSTISTSN
jgi:hypothetical protein